MSGETLELAFSTRFSPNKVSVVWKIADFDKKFGKSGARMESPKFCFSNAMCSVLLYPNATKDAYKDHIALSLNCVTPSVTEHDLEVKFRLADNLGRSLHSKQFTRKCVWETYFVFPQFTGGKKISDLLINNMLIVQCDVRLNKKFEDQASKTPQNSPKFTIRRDDCSCCKTFEAIFENKELSDLVLRVGGEVIPAHKVILSSESKVFQAMLANEMKERLDNSIDLIEMDVSVAKEMLRYMYTKNVNALSFDKALGLYVAADRYDLTELKEKCRVFLGDHLTFNNVCGIISLADLHSDDILALRARDFFSKNFKNVLVTGNWEALETEKPKFCCNLLKDILKNVL